MTPPAAADAASGRPADPGGAEVPRRLVLLRHAKAEHHGGVGDEMRTLTPSGRRQAALAGQMLVESGFEPDYVLCSSAVRTRQTYELASAAFATEPEVVFSEDLYGAGLSGTLAVIAGAPADARAVLVVGHEPVMSGVASVLAGPESSVEAVARVRVGVPTGAFSILEVPTSWSGLARGGALLRDVRVASHHS